MARAGSTTITGSTTLYSSATDGGPCKAISLIADSGTDVTGYCGPLHQPTDSFTLKAGETATFCAAAITNLVVTTATSAVIRWMVIEQ